MATPSLFVLGNPRSGTTIFRLLLSAHPQISIPPECGFAQWLADAYSSERFPEATEQFYRDVIKCKKFETWGLTLDDLTSESTHYEPSNFQEAVGNVYKAYARKRHRPDALLGDKNNYYIELVPELHHHFPEASILWITRDPRDVFCSYLDLSARRLETPYAPKLDTSAEAFSTKWGDAYAAMSDAKKRFGTRFHELRYEDLAKSPKDSLEACCRHLGLAFHPAMLRAHESSDEPTEFLAWKEKTTSPINPSMVGRHLRDLPPQDRETIESLLAGPMRTLGYL